MDPKVVVWVVFLFGGCFTTDPDIELEELKGRDFLLLLNKKSSENYNKETLADWGYASNITEANLQNQVSLPILVILTFKINKCQSKPDFEHFPKRSRCS